MGPTIEVMEDPIDIGEPARMLQVVLGSERTTAFEFANLGPRWNTLGRGSKLRLNAPRERQGILLLEPSTCDIVHFEPRASRALEPAAGPPPFEDFDASERVEPTRPEPAVVDVKKDGPTRGTVVGVSLAESALTLELELERRRRRVVRAAPPLHALLVPRDQSPAALLPKLRALFVDKVFTFDLDDDLLRNISPAT